MRDMWKVLNACRAQVERHPFFEYLRSDDVPPSERLVFTPVLIDFIMSFADMNKWFLRYPEPSSEWERAINDHTSEDATHSLLFVHNWSHLDLGDTPEWRASKALWWMFLSKESLVVRELGMDILRLAVQFPDPLVRFPMMEAIEICGDIFFEHTSLIAQRLQAETNTEHLYYGPYHRARETGHLQADEGSFESARLSDEQRVLAEHAARTVFGHFLRLFDHMLDFSRRAAADRGGLERAIQDEYAAALQRPSAGGAEHPQQSVRAHIASAHPPLLAQLEARVSKLRQHPWIELLHKRPAALETFQNFVPLWGVDVVSYGDFNQLVLRYPEPQSEDERSVNRWAEQLASHGVLFLQDWEALGLDDLLDWKMGDAVSYFFLSEHTELHRHNMSRIKTLAMRHTAPFVRFWLMVALELGGDVLFDATREPALELERELGVPLNYWTQRHGLVEPMQRESRNDSLWKRQPAADEAHIVSCVIDTVFDNFEQQFDLSYRTCQMRVFSTAAPTLPPIRSLPAVPQPATATVRRVM